MKQKYEPQKYGPKTETVEAFLRHLRGMTPEQWELARLLRSLNDDPEYWEAAREAAWRAAGEAAREAAREAAGDAREAAGDAWEAAWRAAWEAAWRAAREAAREAAIEILGADLMRERGQPFCFLPLFGFANPEEIPE
jgi:hypothetical protein